MKNHDPAKPVLQEPYLIYYPILAIALTLIGLAINLYSILS